MPTQPKTTPATPPGRPAGTRRCRTCTTPTGALVQGDCPDCAGLVPLPLRGPGGRFLRGLTVPTAGMRGRS